MKPIDVNNYHNRLIIAAMLGMVEDEGMTTQDVYTRIDDIKNQVHFALVEAEQQRKGKTD